MITFELIMVTSPLSHFSKLTLKNAHFCIILPYFYKHELNELGYTSQVVHEILTVKEIISVR